MKPSHLLLENINQLVYYMTLIIRAKSIKNE